jgi:cyclic beta-1,2-glucan synthetase
LSELADPARARLTSTETLEQHAQRLAQAQQPLTRAKRRGAALTDFDALARAVELAASGFRTARPEDPAYQKAGEWILDNHYLIARSLRQARSDLPGQFRRHLPHVGTDELPRVLGIARELVAATSLDFDEATLLEFTEAYQELATLSIAELWALPTMLRISVLEALVTMLGAYFPCARAPGAWWERPLEPAVGIGRAVRSLRQLAEIDWKAFVGKTSAVNAALRADPAQLYARMDFTTRDAYRKAVEDLAWGSGRDEAEVARLAVALAAEQANDVRQGHVGYYLIDRGRTTFERQLGYRATFRERGRRALLAHPTLSYLGAIGSSTLLLVAALAAWGAHELGAAQAVALGMLAIVPISSIVVALTNWAITTTLPPRTLPKLDFSEKVPEDCKTAVAIPAILSSPKEVDQLLAQLELHYLANPDPSLVFVLLADYVDSKQMPEDGALLAHAERALMALNQRYASEGRRPFHILYRTARWNEAEGVFMGWERKRGKLDEFNRLLRGDRTTSFEHRFGDAAGLLGIRFVITLDSDTQLPLDAARRLIGLMAHPLNRAEIDPRTGCVVSGYSVVQPRVEASPLGRAASWFSRTCAGDTALDIYTRAVSDVYQDLFGSGVYIGKGIYDLDAFMQSLEGRVPENAVASHDLFEGIHARAALATDVVLYEEYPQHYLAFARRLHRWIRGDWQLLPWLLPLWAGLNRKFPRLPLCLIDRWKIADNMRRSLLAPSLLGLLVLGWFAAPEHALLWTLATLTVPLLMSLPSLLGGHWRASIGRWALAVAFLPYEAGIVLDAIGRVLVRLSITRKHLLQWVTAANTANALNGKSSYRVVFRGMRWALLFTLALLASVAWFRPAALLAAAPLFALWLISPEIARRVSKTPNLRTELAPGDRRSLRRLARRTWLFFETFVGPGDQWLPPDNFQHEPVERVAHRTSPTNIGLMLVAQLSARDLGYIGASELAALFRQAFESLGRLERYRGHWLNWYDTKTLLPLLPRYVSSVDSGNLAASLIVIAKACRDQTDAPLVGSVRWEGLVDALDLFEQALEGLPRSLRPRAELIARVRARLERAIETGDDLRTAAASLSESEVPLLERALLEALEASTDHHDVPFFREARTWLDRFQHQLQCLRSELETYFPWLALSERAKELGLELDVLPDNPRTLSPRGAAEACASIRAALREREPTSEEAARFLEQAEELLETAEARARTLCEELAELAARAESWRSAMDFTFLFDPKRKLFHIGYDAETDKLDPHFYDLLASEARLSSFLAIVQKQAPPTHWHALGRPVTRIRGSVALVSWGGTMFEYLLPSVFMQSSPNTLLAQSTALAVGAQIDWGKRNGTPWGISESGFAEVDAQQNYQYRSFGVPGLGLKRGLEDDLVVSPYSCVLAVSLNPQAVLDNLAQLDRLGALGTYGLFEAIDFHPTRAEEASREPGRAPFSVVRSHMAHHQAMVLAALDNVLNGNILVERFHADPLVKTGELMLSERLPSLDATEPLTPPRSESAGPPPVAAASYPAWTPDRSTSAPAIALLTNGRLTTLVTDTGGGWTRWKGLAITRGSSDPTCDVDGLWIYVRDDDSGRVWSAMPAPTRARTPGDHISFHPHTVEFHHRDEGISLRTEIAVTPLDDVEIRALTLHNETDEPRTLTLVSFAEPVLESAASAARHPAFSRMFLECEAVPDQHGVLGSRRKRDPHDPGAVVVHRAVWDSPAVSFLGCELDRQAFIGRRRDARAPGMLVEPAKPSDATKGGLDPVMALALRVTLEPAAIVKVAFVTAVAKTRRTALEIARRFGSVHAGDWGVRDAERASARRLDRAGIAPELFPSAMQLVSRLLVPSSELRAARDTLIDANPSKRQLWGHGISGDDPLLVVRVQEPDETSLVEEVLATYRYLRACKLPVELVFLDAAASGYLGDDASGVRRTIARLGASAWLQQRGGIFVLAIDQLATDQRRRIEASASVLLDTAQGSLGEQLQALPTPAPPLPHFSGSASEDTRADRPLTKPKLQFANGHGGFTEDGREYVIDAKSASPTPAPWCNVLANAELGCLVSESSLGATWSQNSGENRLTPWRNDPVSDAPSEVLYLRDEETAEVWSPTPLPAGLDSDTLVRHGAGYTIYERESHALGQKLTVFVPPDAPVKIVRLSLKNLLARPRRLTATYYVEWVLGTLREEQQTHVVSALDAHAHCILARSAWNADFRERVAFVAADRAPHGFTCDRAEFIGKSGSLRDPEALRRWGLAGSTDPAADPCAALQTHVDLAPGQTLELHFVLGEGRDEKHAIEFVERFREPAEVDAAWRRLNAYWDRQLSAVQVKTPEPAMDLMLNRWLLYQSLSSRFFARSAFYQSSGAFGFRDQLQDVMAFIPALPELARAHILEAAAHQFEEGDVLHWWHPPAGRGVRTRYSDDLLWLPFVVAHYVAATGDRSILEEQVPFLTAPELRPEEHDRYGEFARAAEPASLLEHCRRALDRGFTEGPHGLPLIGGGDWNDGMNRVGAHGRGESVWLAWFVSATAIAFAELLTEAGQGVEAAHWRERASALNARIEQTAWDGDWYVRAFYDDGSPLGSSRSRSCQIDSIAQSWAILSGAGDRERSLHALRSADERLVRERERLVLLLAPPFQGARHDPGYIAAYPPGVRENGGQYTHASAWLGWAYARIGDGAAAMRIFDLLNPIHRTQTDADVERYRVEPYVLAADVYGAPPFTGRGGWTWYTGAAAWTWRLGVEAILGLYREAGGLRLDPCIPPEWPGFEATLRIDDRELHVTVDNPQRTGRGIRTLTLDGVELSSAVVKLPAARRPRHELRIVLGVTDVEAATQMNDSSPRIWSAG